MGAMERSSSTTQATKHRREKKQDVRASLFEDLDPRGFTEPWRWELKVFKSRRSVCRMAVIGSGRHLGPLRGFLQDLITAGTAGGSTN